MDEQEGIPQESPLVPADEFFDSMTPKSEGSVTTSRQYILKDGTVIEGLKTKQTADEVIFTVKKGRSAYLGFTVNSSGLKELRVDSLRTSIGGMTILRQGAHLKQEDVEGRANLRDAAYVLVNWLSKMVLNNRFVSPPFDAEAELE